MWIVFAFTSAFLAGITTILIKCGMKDVNSNVAALLRTAVVLLFSWLMVVVTGVLPEILDITIKSVIFLVLSGITTGASWLCYYKALQTGDVNKVTPIDKCSTVLSMLMAIVILGEPLSWLMVFSMLLIGGGTIMMVHKTVLQQEKSEILRPGGKIFQKWFLYAIGSAGFAALTAILSKIGISDVNSTLGTAIRTIIVLIMAWQIVEITGRKKEIRNLDMNNWKYLVLSGCTTGGSWLCYFKALQAGPASVVVPIDKLSILVTIGLSRLVFQEKLTQQAAFGLAMVVAGTLLLLV